MKDNILVTSSAMPARGSFSALRHANFRLYFIGQLISTAGTWMQNIAQAYLVFQITQNPLWSGLVACAAGLPLVLLAPVAGVVVESVPRRQIMLVTQTIQMILAFLLTALVFFNVVQIWHIVVLAFVLGITNAVDQPSRQTFVVELVGREDLQSGIQLNSLLNSSARLVGPAAAGLALVALGPVWCFFFNGLSFLAVLASLIPLKVPFAIPPRHGGAPLVQLMEGLRFARQDKLIAPLLLLTSCVGLFILPTLQLFAPYAAQSLHSADQGYAAMSVGEGLGAVIAGAIAAIVLRKLGRGRAIVVMALLNTISNAGIAFQVQILPAAFLSVLAGLFTVLEMVTINTTIQTSVPDEYRGRVMALYSLGFFGLLPFGALILGIIAERTGTAFALLITSLACGLFSALILLRWPHVIHSADLPVADRVPAAPAGASR